MDAVTLTMGSLFDGIGGFPLAFERHGFACKWSVEIDKDCNRVLSRHWPDVPKYLDVCEVGAHNLCPVDVITFGSPCQDLSVAGKRGGLDGARSSLFYEAIRICDELKPTLALWENVPGAFSSHAGRDFTGVLLAFRELRARDICWRTLDAQHFGVPQRRRRIFLVADFGGERAGEILLDAAGLSGNPEAGNRTGTGLAGDSGCGPEVPCVAVAHTTGQGWWTEGFGGLRGDAGGMEQSGHLVATERTDGALRTQPYFDHAGDEDKLVTVGAQSANGVGTCGADDNQAQANHLIPATAGPLTSRTGKGANTTVDDGALVVGVTNRGFAVEDGAHETLRAESHGAIPMVAQSVTGETAHALSSEGADASEDGTGRGTPIVALAQNQRGELRTSEVHPQLTAGGGKPGEGYPCIAFNSKAGHDIGYGEDVSPAFKAGESHGPGHGASKPPAVAFTERTRSQGRTFESQEEQAYALTNPGSGGRTHSRQLYDGYGVRRLTPMECERLQGFPDGHTAIDGNGKVIADSARYRMLGNSVAVPVVAWIAQRMAAALSGEVVP